MKFTRRNKYRVAPKADRSIGDKVYASKAEMLYAHELRTLNIAFTEQPVVMLGDTGIKYIPDFLVERDGSPEYIDVKGMQTPVFRIKKRLWKLYGPAPLRIVKRTHHRFKTVEIVPKGSKVP